MIDYSKFTIPKILNSENEMSETESSSENESEEVQENTLPQIEFREQNEQLTFELKNEGFVISFSSRFFNVQELLNLALNARDYIQNNNNRKKKEANYAG